MSESAVNSKGQPVCGVPCHYGGTSAARKHSGVDLGRMWHCNQVVRVPGTHCWRHSK